MTFTVIGERINTSRERVRQAVEQRDTSYIQEDVIKQQKAGATYIDVNAGARIGHEMQDMEWLIGVIQEVVTAPLCLDSPDPRVLERALGIVQQPPIINSITLETDRFQPMLSFLRGMECSVTALCMDDTGLPKSVRDVIERADQLIDGLMGAGIKHENIHIDPLIQPISTDSSKGTMTLEAVGGIMREYPQVHTVCGLSNISFGLPQRRIINRTFLCLLMGAGLDGAIVDPLDSKIMAVLKTTLMLLGKDDFCQGYIKAVRAGEIVS